MKFIILHEKIEYDIYSLTFDATNNEYIGIISIFRVDDATLKSSAPTIPGVIAGLTDLLDNYISKLKNKNV